MVTSQGDYSSEMNYKINQGIFEAKLVANKPYIIYLIRKVSISLIIVSIITALRLG